MLALWPVDPAGPRRRRDTEDEGGTFWVEDIGAAVGLAGHLLRWNGRGLAGRNVKRAAPPPWEFGLIRSAATFSAPSGGHGEDVLEPEGWGGGQVPW